MNNHKLIISDLSLDIKNNTNTSRINDILTHENIETKILINKSREKSLPRIIEHSNKVKKSFSRKHTSENNTSFSNQNTKQDDLETSMQSKDLKETKTRNKTPIPNIPKKNQTTKISNFSLQTSEDNKSFNNINLSILIKNTDQSLESTSTLDKKKISLIDINEKKLNNSISSGKNEKVQNKIAENMM